MFALVIGIIFGIVMAVLVGALSLQYTMCVLAQKVKISF